MEDQAVARIGPMIEVVAYRKIDRPPIRARLFHRSHIQIFGFILEKMRLVAGGDEGSFEDPPVTPVRRDGRVETHSAAPCQTTNGTSVSDGLVAAARIWISGIIVRVVDRDPVSYLP